MASNCLTPFFVEKLSTAQFSCRSVRRLAQQKQDRLAQLTSVVQEQFSSIRTVRAFNGEHYELARFGEHVGWHNEYFLIVALTHFVRI